MSLRPLAVVVPAKDEELRLPRLLDTLSNGGRESLRRVGLEVTEIVVADDGSTDGTAALVAERAACDPRIRLVRPARGHGKGAAVRAGVLAATAQWALVMDADLATPIDEAGKLADALDAGADVAIGSRGLDASAILVHQPRHRELAGKAFNLMVRVLTRLPYHDTQCGFKLFRLAAARPLFEQQRIDGFAYDVELLLAARRLGLAVAEIPVRWLDDPQTRVRLVPASFGMTRDLIRTTVRDGWLRGPWGRPGIGKTIRQGGTAE